MPERRMSIEAVRRDAVFAAARQHNRLHTDLGKRIDIFDIIQRDGLWLMFQPLKNLYGSYLIIDNYPGVLINSSHPLNLQRFTASHEYGHYVLGHELSFDDEEAIYNPRVNRNNVQEAAAQSFAGNFLMPLQLVNTVLRDMGLPPKPENLTPQDAYRFSLKVGVSYGAAVTHLETLKKISREAANELRKQEPKDIKAIIGFGTRPQDTRADTWALSEQDSGQQVYSRVNDELYISLPETPSTGYLWTIDSPSFVDLRKASTEHESEGEEYLELVYERFEPKHNLGEEIHLGAGGLRHFAFRLLRSGSQMLRLVNRRPWLKNGGRLKIFEISLNILPNRIQGLRAQQHESLVA